MICEVCFTDSWEPCPPNTPDAVPNISKDGYMICGYCHLENVNERLQLENKQLRSDLSSKNWMLDKALIDVAISQQEIKALKEQGELQKIQIQQMKQLNEVVNNVDYNSR